MFSPERILTIRKSKGYSQEVLAEQSGVSLRTIQRVEQGDTVPRGHTLQALAAALGVSLDDFRAGPALPPGPAPQAATAASEAAPAPVPPVTTPPADLPPAPAGRGAGAGAEPEGAGTPAALTLTVRRPQELVLPAAAPATSALRPDPQFLQLLNLSALSFLLLPLLNIVVPMLLWRARRRQVAHAAEVGRRVLGFQILWQAASTVVYLLLVLLHWGAARFFQVRLPDTFMVAFIGSYVLNVLVVGRAALQLRGGRLDIYPVRL